MSARAIWEDARLGDIGQSLIGLTYSPNNVRRSGTLVLRSSNIQDGQLAFEDNVYVDSPIPPKIRVRKNDILICVRNGSRRLIGKSVMLDERVVGQTFGAFMAVYRSDVNQFLQYFFQSDDFKNQIDEHLGATINQITNGSLNSFVVAIPDNDEQKVIVAKLHDADRLIGTLDRLIAKKRSIKQGMMQQLLTGRTRLPGIYDEWSAGIFEQIATPAKDRTWPKYVEPQTLLVELEQIKSRSGCLATRSSASSAISMKTRFEPGDVLFGKLRAYLRKYWLADSPGICTTEIWALRPRPAVSSEFLRYMVESDGFIEVASGAYGTHMPRSDWGVVRNYRIMIPSFLEQQRIGEVLADVDREVSALRAQLAKARDIKTGMMQQLLSGRTRLPAEATA